MGWNFERFLELNMGLHNKPLIQNDYQSYKKLPRVDIQFQKWWTNIKGLRQAKEFLNVHHLNRPGPIKKAF